MHSFHFDYSVEVNHMFSLAPVYRCCCCCCCCWISACLLHDFTLVTHRYFGVQRAIWLNIAYLLCMASINKIYGSVDWIDNRTTRVWNTYTHQTKANLASEKSKYWKIFEMESKSCHSSHYAQFVVRDCALRFLFFFFFSINELYVRRDRSCN